MTSAQWFATLVLCMPLQLVSPASVIDGHVLCLCMPPQVPILVRWLVRHVVHTVRACVRPIVRAAQPP